MRGRAVIPGLLTLTLLLVFAPGRAWAAEPDSSLGDTPPVAEPSPEPEGSAQPAPTPEVPTPSPVESPAVEPHASRVLTGSFYSQAMNMPRAYDIYLPPSYDLAVDRSYPVLYLLHGDGGRIDSWPSLGLRAKMDQAIANGAPEMIVVMPDGAGHYGDLTDWANRWDGTDQVEDQVVELVGVIDQAYRTLPDRSNRFIGGLSSGGFGALNIALRHTDLFSTAMSFSGFIAADDPESDPGVFGTDRGYIEDNSPSTLVASQSGAADIYYVLTGGKNDPYFAHRMAQFSGELDNLEIPHEFHLVPGGHDGIAWAAGLDFGLEHLSEQLRVPSRSEPRGERE